MIFSQSRGNLLVCKELTLEKMKSANFNFPHNQFNSKESVVFFLLACDHALSLYLCNLFSQAKEAKKQKKNNAWSQVIFLPSRCVFVWLYYILRTTGLGFVGTGLPWIFRLFWTRPKLPSWIKALKKNLPNFPTQEIPSISPVTWNPKYPTSALPWEENRPLRMKKIKTGH